MIVAGLQTDIAWEDPTESFGRVDEWAARASGTGARLLVLPEMFATGFSMDAARVSRYGGAIREYLSNLAHRQAVWVIGGYAEAADPAVGDGGPHRRKPRNACVLFGPDGAEALRYHKIHPFTLAGEHEHYAGGTELVTTEVEGVRITPLICYDLRFPEPFRIAAADTDLFVVIANWPSPRRHAWRTLLVARAIENQTYVLGVNRVGEGDGQVYAGESALIDPLGETIAAAAGQPALVVGDVDPGAVADVRARFSFLADRRADVYAEVAARRRGPA